MPVFRPFARIAQLFGVAVLGQIVLSAANFLMGFLLIRRTSDTDYALFVLGIRSRRRSRIRPQGHEGQSVERGDCNHSVPACHVVVCGLDRHSGCNLGRGATATSCGRILTMPNDGQSWGRWPRYRHEVISLHDLRTGSRGIPDHGPGVQSPGTGAPSRHEPAQSRVAHSARMELRRGRAGISLGFVQAHAVLLARYHRDLVPRDAIGRVYPALGPPTLGLAAAGYPG
jgi:hypothetical protein